MIETRVSGNLFMQPENYLSAHRFIRFRSEINTAIENNWIALEFNLYLSKKVHDKDVLHNIV